MSIYSTNTHGERNDGRMKISSKGKQNLEATAPPEFKGPEGEWSPEDLFSASISSCYLLSFKALAQARKMDWDTLDVKADAKLERKDGKLTFTNVEIQPNLVVSGKENVEDYLKLLEETQHKCLVTNSMNCKFTLNPKIKVA
ncbi:OsmC family protein [Halobacteriovorax sp. GFR7]|uniref:OsmC family protein n=1 Tax=unclassified Halobacteriovorax TaxID=2639665 RepID=UPI003D97740A